MSDDAQEHEFDDVAAWTADVLVARDPATAIAAACRGSGGPAALAWLAESLELAEGTWLLDVGSGLGGPMAWVQRRFRARPVGSDPMVGAVRGGVRLFGVPAVVAAEVLPFAPRSFEAAWTLGVLDTVDQPDRLLDEVHRCLVPGGGFGVLAYVADEPIPDAERPEGNCFPSRDELLSALGEAGFVVVDHVDAARVAPMPTTWRERQDEVEDELQRRHGRDERWVQAKENEERFGALLDDGRVEAVLVHARRF